MLTSQLRFDKRGIPYDVGSAKVQWSLVGSSLKFPSVGKNGCGSLYNLGDVNSYLETTSPIFDLSDASVDFTFGMWINMKMWAGKAYPDRAGIMSKGEASAGNGFSITNNGPVYLYINGNTTVATTQQATLDSWQYFSWVRKGTQHRLSLDGVLTSPATGAISVNSAPFRLAHGWTYSSGWLWTANYVFNGFMSDFQFTRGKALWWDKCTPPRRTSPSPRSLLVTPSIQQSLGVR
jgi:hypothetical protein